MVPLHSTKRKDFKMAITPSNMLPLSTPAPSFVLQDVLTNKLVCLDALKSDKATVVIFMCNHCPYVKHVLKGIAEVAHQYMSKGVSFIGINSNDIKAYPTDAPEFMKPVARDLGFPYLFDETQEVARAYDAACTPDFFVFDKELKLAYRGQFDDSRPGNALPVTGKDLKSALDALLLNIPVSPLQKPSIGCNIKWKP